MKAGLGHKWDTHCLHHDINNMMFMSLIPRPLPPKEMPGTHCLCMRKIFSVKSFLHFLVHMRKIILTKNTKVSLN